MYQLSFVLLFFFNDTATTEIYTLSLHDALPISGIIAPNSVLMSPSSRSSRNIGSIATRSEEHTSELQSLTNLVCRLLLEKKKNGRMKEQETHSHFHARGRRDV